MSKRTQLASVAIVALVAISGVWLSRQGQDTVSSETPNTKQQPNFELLSQVNEEGQVSVSVEPLNGLSATDEVWQFAVILSTHSVDLNMDAAETFVLVGDTGEEYRVASWTGDPPGGHHRELVLEFPRIQPRPQTVTIIAKEIDGVPERRLLWNLAEDSSSFKNSRN